MLPLEHLKSQRGLTLVELLLGLALSIIMWLLLSNLLASQLMTVKSISQRLDRTDAVNSILRTVANPAICSCQLDLNLNKANAANLKVDLSDPKSVPDLKIDQWWEDCDFTRPVALVGNPLPGGTNKVISVKMTNIQQMKDNKYRGTLRFAFANGASELFLEPIENSIAFEIDPSSGTPAERRISRCLSPAASVASRVCPAGTIMLGDPDEPSSFCVETTRHSDTDHDTAGNYCAKTFNRGNRCSHSQLVAACKSGKVPGMTDWEISNGMPTKDHVMVSIGGGDCFAMGVKWGEAPYRCCIN